MEASILNQLDYKITLYTLSLIKTSIVLWEQPEIKIKIQDFFSNIERKQNEWHTITQKILNLVDASNAFAAPVLSELKDAILDTGRKIYDWTSYVIEQLCLDASYAKDIFWTPHGFIDEKKIFKTVWENDPSLYENSDKRIFQIACIFTQENFIEKHQDEMVRELKKVESLSNVDLEVINKTYGIISTYLAYYIKQDILKEKIIDHDNCDEVSQILAKWQKIVRGDLDASLILYDDLIAAVKGAIMPPKVMAKLCAIPGLIYGVEYYYKKLNNTEKQSVRMWINKYCRTKSWGVTYRSRKFKEILVFFEYTNCIYIHVPVSSQLTKLLEFCPLESVVWPVLIKQLRKVKYDRNILWRLLQDIFYYIESDYDLQLPVKRNLVQKSLKEVLIKASNSKSQVTKDSLICIFISLCKKIKDFTILKTFLIHCQYDASDFQRFLRGAFLFISIDWLVSYDEPNFDAGKAFLSQMFDSSEDSNTFFIAGFYENIILTQGRFDKWESCFSGFNYFDRQLRDCIDPVKCLGLFIKGKPYFGFEPLETEKFDKFVRWWHESEEYQVNLKDKFRTSSYPSECIYRFWLLGNQNPENDCWKFLEWLFDSEDAIVEFKKEKLTVLGLLDASFDVDFYESPFGTVFKKENVFHAVIHEFINFCGTSESLSNVKEEIRGRIEELMLNDVRISSVSTFNFLMELVSMCEVDKKKVFQELNDQSKMLKLCESALVYDEQEPTPGTFIFYNDWLKLSGNISDLKRGVISIFKAERNKEFISKLSLMYEKLERGEVLSAGDIIFDKDD